MAHERDERHALMCREVWGGNHKVVRTVALPSLEAWIAASPMDEGEGGGDLHYLSVCDFDLLSRTALADVSGHGRGVNAVTRTLHTLMRENVNVWDQSNLMRGLNDMFGAAGGGQYATAIVMAFHRVEGRLAFSSAGHLPPLWYHAAQGQWGWLEEDVEARTATISGVPVGLIPGTTYRQTVVALEPRDLLVLYTDGITDAEDEGGQDLGRERLLAWAGETSAASPRAVGEALLRRLDAFRGSRRTDDETLVILQREAAPLAS